MFSLFYNLLLGVLGVLLLPKILWQRCVHGKYKGTLLNRLGRLPVIDLHGKSQVIWIHTVSMGETRAAIPLFDLLRTAYSDAAIVISTTTETGHEEAKKSMPQAKAHFLLPLDFSWNMKRLCRRIQPDLLILVESDFWYHLLSCAKKAGASVVLVNGKVSERSTRRFRKIPWFTHKLFGCFDHLCVQSEHFRKRFIDMGIDPSKITSTGNLKFDVALSPMTAASSAAWKERLKIQRGDRVITIGSSHAPEEDQLLSALELIWNEVPTFKVLLVPRHPQRFDEVAKLLSSKNIRYGRYTASESLKGDEQVILIDTMGQLNSCYQISELAIVAGSFTDKVGGHNVFEPVLLGIPVLFGPYMHTQPDLTTLVLNAKAGKQVRLDEVAKTVLSWLKTPEKRAPYAEACRHLAQETQGSARRSLDVIKRFLGSMG